MTIFLICVLTFIVLTLVFITYTCRWLFKEQVKVNPFLSNIGPMIIEKAYRAVDVRYNFEYTTMDAVRNKPFDYFSTELVIRDDNHKQYIIEKFTKKMAEEMLRSGLIEIVEQENIDSPYRRRIQLRAKVYKPE